MLELVDHMEHTHRLCPQSRRVYFRWGWTAILDPVMQRVLFVLSEVLLFAIRVPSVFLMSTTCRVRNTYLHMPSVCACVCWQSLQQTWLPLLPQSPVPASCGRWEGVPLYHVSSWPRFVTIQVSVCVNKMMRFRHSSFVWRFIGHLCCGQAAIVKHMSTSTVSVLYIQLSPSMVKLKQTLYTTSCMVLDSVLQVHANWSGTAFHRNSF